MKRKIIRISIVLAVVLIGAAFGLLPIARERARRAQCFHVLDCCIRKAMKMYSMDHNEGFPTSIVEMADYADSVRLYICPGSGTKTPDDLSVKDMTNWLDYIYIHWPDGENTPSNYPLLYDRRLSHHQGKGINLAPVDGPAFWDEGAQWLQTFAKDHPELDIPMPEDLQ